MRSAPMGQDLESSVVYTENISSFLSSVDKVGFDVDSQNGTPGIEIEWVRFNWEFP